MISLDSHPQSFPFGTLAAACVLTLGSGPTALQAHPAHGPRDSASTKHAASPPDTGSTTWVQLSAGHNTTCGITDAQKAYCWGGRNLYNNAPAPVSDTLRFVDIDVGYGGHKCALTPDGVPYCWDDTGGTPEKVPGAPRLEQVSVYEDHACGVAPDGDAHCWGRDFKGRLGFGRTAAEDRDGMFVDEPRLHSAEKISRPEANARAEDNEKLKRRAQKPVTVVGGLSFTVVTVGSLHSCGLTADSTAYCWGSNGSGRLGTGTKHWPGIGPIPHSAEPIPVAGDLSFTQISAARRHTCGLTTDHVAYCWGTDDRAALGNGPDETGDRIEPERVETEQTFVEVVAGQNNSCGLTKTGQAYCWGHNGGEQLEAGMEVDYVHRPEPVAEGLSFVELVAGRAHICGRTETGASYCWGSNTKGQLGKGTIFLRASPVEVAGGHTFETLDAGLGHTCGLTPDGRAYCWGLNRDGQLGNGRTGHEPAPVPVAGQHRFVQISAGGKVGGGQEEHTCAVTRSGKAYCWGRNNIGQLGTGTTENSTTPVPVKGNLSFESVIVGGRTTCGLVEEGKLYCWPVGSRQSGPEPVAPRRSFRDFAHSTSHECGIDEHDVAYCRGYNHDGEVGVETTQIPEARQKFMQVASDRRFQQITTGWTHTCAVTTDGAAYCWGGGGSTRKLGIGENSLENVLQPTPVKGGHAFVQIDAHKAHTCGVTRSGDAYCWGAAGGHLGHGGLGDSDVPIKVAGSLTFQHVSVGRDHSCGLTEEGAAYCWGSTHGGLLGIGEEAVPDYTIPEPVRVLDTDHDTPRPDPLP